MENLYYQAPADELFHEVKKEAIKIWESYDNTHGYSDDKVGRIKDIENVSDNFMYMVAMFDMPNQGKLASNLSEEARSAIRERMIAGGSPEEYIVF